MKKKNNKNIVCIRIDLQETDLFYLDIIQHSLKLVLATQNNIFKIFLDLCERDFFLTQSIIIIIYLITQRCHKYDAL